MFPFTLITLFYMQRHDEHAIKIFRIFQRSYHFQLVLRRSQDPHEGQQLPWRRGFHELRPQNRCKQTFFKNSSGGFDGRLINVRTNWASTSSRLIAAAPKRRLLHQHHLLLHRELPERKINREKTFVLSESAFKKLRTFENFCWKVNKSAHPFWKAVWAIRSGSQKDDQIRRNSRHLKCRLQISWTSIASLISRGATLFANRLSYESVSVWKNLKKLVWNCKIG